MEAYTSHLLRKTLKDGDCIIHHSPDILTAKRDLSKVMLRRQTSAGTVLGPRLMPSLLIQDLALPPRPSGVPAVTLNVWAEAATQGNVKPACSGWGPRVTGPLVRRRALHESGGDPRPVDDKTQHCKIKGISPE